MKRIILLTAFDGDGPPGRYKDQIEHLLIPNVRKYMDYLIVLCTDNAKAYKSNEYECAEVEGISKGHERYGYRSSDYWRVAWTLSLHDTTVMYLDADILIIDKAFVKGFDLAERFGFCLPESPRVYSYIETMKGVDAFDKQLFRRMQKGLYGYATSYITGVMFMSPDVGNNTRLYMQSYIDTMRANPERGPCVAIKAALHTGFAPYVLPSQWCATYYNKQWIKDYKHASALAIQASDPGVKSAFRDNL